MSRLQSLKCSMSLPLSQQQQQQQQRQAAGPLSAAATPEDLLASLGLTMTPTMMLASPDLLLAAAGLGGSFAADGCITPTSFLNPKFVTEEQERFVMNFDEKIRSLMSIKRESQPVATLSEEDEAEEAEEADEDVYQFSGEVAMEMDTAASSSSSPRRQPPPQAATGPDSSSDLQLRRLERKRRRNRDAARRCREKKLEKLQSLDERAAELRQLNDRLKHDAATLRAQVDALRLAAMGHADACNGTSLAAMFAVY